MSRNGVIEIGPFQVQIVDVYFTNADVDVGVRHDLPTPPIGYVAIRRSPASTIYDGTNPPKSRALQVRSTVAGVTAKLVVISLNLTER